ncbi:MAG: hypothetical protein JSR53_12975, partial [Proteobacteria bacterium]|nr:hypothetical protein [Pseudomonadota bacterium]
MPPRHAAAPPAPAAQPVTRLARWRVLLARYWACNMTLVYDLGSGWPGFGYTPDETQDMRAVAVRVRRTEFGAWVLLVVLLALPMLGVGMWLGLSLLDAMAGGAGNAARLPASLLYLMLALQVLLALSVVLPAGMLAAAALTGYWFKVPDAALPGHDFALHYGRRLWLQLTRMAALSASV